MGFENLGERQTTLGAPIALMVDGNSSAIAAAGSGLGSLPGSDAGLDTSGLYVRFLIDDPPDGSYTLRFTPGSWFIPENGATEATFDFTLQDRIRGSSRG